MLRVTSNGCKRVPGPRRIWVCRRGFASNVAAATDVGLWRGALIELCGICTVIKALFCFAVRPCCREDISFFSPSFLSFFFFSPWLVLQEGHGGKQGHTQCHRREEIASHRTPGALPRLIAAQIEREQRFQLNTTQRGRHGNVLVSGNLLSQHV